MFISKLRRLVSHQYSAKLAEKLIDAVEELETEVKRLQGEVAKVASEGAQEAKRVGLEAHDRYQETLDQFSGAVAPGLDEKGDE